MYDPKNLIEQTFNASARYFLITGSHPLMFFLIKDKDVQVAMVQGETLSEIMIIVNKLATESHADAIIYVSEFSISPYNLNDGSIIQPSKDSRGRDHLLLYYIDAFGRDKRILASQIYKDQNGLLSLGEPKYFDTNLVKTFPSEDHQIKPWRNDTTDEFIKFVKL